MWLDADDFITEENRKRLITLKSLLDNSIDYILMQYRVSHSQDGSSTVIFPKVRISRRAMDMKWHGAVHENLLSHGNGESVEIYIDHKYKDQKPSLERNMKIMKQEIDSGRADYGIHYFYGLAQYYEDNFEEAEQYLNLVIEAGRLVSYDPISLLVALHNIYRNRGDFAKAQAILEDNEYLMSDKSEFYCCLGLFYQDCLNDFPKACNIYIKALKCQGTCLIKEIPGQREPSYYYYIPNMLLGKAFVRLKDPENALMYFEQALTYKYNEEIYQITKKLEQLIELEQNVLV